MEPSRLKVLSLRDLFLELIDMSADAETVAKVNLATELASRLEHTQAANPIDMTLAFAKRIFS